MFALCRLDAPDSEGNTVQERYNADGAKVFGLNLEARAVLTRWLTLQAGFTWQKSRYDTPQEWNEEVPEQTVRRMLRTPDSYGYFTATVTPFKNFSASLSGNYTGHMLVGHSAGSGIETPELVNTPNFMTLNLKLTYDIPVYKYLKLQVNAGIQNITNAYQKDFDCGWDRDSEYIYGPSLPRSIFAGVKFIY